MLKIFIAFGAIVNYRGDSLFFDPRPKRRREDLYDRDEELRELISSVRSVPLTVVTGVRRSGKTSLILVGLGEMGARGVVIDLRGAGGSREDLYRRVEGSVNEFFRENRDVWRLVRSSLKNISGVQVLGSGVSFSWERDVDLAGFFKSLGDAVIVFDEVQYLRGPLGRKLAEIVAYLYDHSDLRVVLSGSEIGLLYDFIGIEDPGSPLYGRYFREIRVGSFSDQQCRDFLRKGFEQHGISPEEEIIGYACEKLDGIVGWLVYFGLRCIETGIFSKETVIEVLEEASMQSIQEFTKFLEKHRPAERRILETARAIARGKSTWSEIKRYLESVEKRTVPDASLKRALDSLLKASYIEKRTEGRNVYYRIIDPTLKHALEKS